MTGLTRARVVGAHAMISEIRLSAGCRVPRHAHANEQMACVITGRMQFEVGDASHSRTCVITAGEVLHLPPNVPHSAEALEDSVVLDVFSPPSEETGIDRSEP